jgi:type I restriction enzyme S subunit
MNWQRVPLSSLALPKSGSFVDGPFGSNLKATEYAPEGVPIIRLQNIRPNEFLAKDIKFISPKKSSELSRHSYEPGDLVISKLGDPPGYACVVPPSAGFGIIVADVVRFRGDPELTDHRYLSHFLNSPEGRQQFLKLSKGTTRTRVNLSSIKTIEIPIPSSLDEQKRIAAVLDRADALRRQRQDSLQLTERFLQSVFIEMFGSEVAPLCPRVRLAEHLDFITSGARGWAKYYSAEGEKFIRSLDVQMNEISDSQIIRVTPPKNAEADRTRSRRGDVLLTITGSLIGRVAPVTEAHAGTFVSQHVAILRTHGFQPEFLSWAMSTQEVQRQIQKNQTGQTKPGLNFEQIRRLTIPRPSEELEVKFSKLIKERQIILAQQREAFEYSHIFFASLQHRAFRGELDLSRLILDSLDETPAAAEPEKSTIVVPESKAGLPFLMAPQNTELALKELDAIASEGDPIPWSADYFRYRILGTQQTPFSFSEVMQRAESVFDEPPYEEIKDMILELLGKGVGRAYLSQRFDIHVDAQSKEASGRKEIVFEPAT